MTRGREVKYESSFEYTKGVLNITPKSWHTFAYETLKRKTVDYVSRLSRDKKCVLIIGVGTGDILPYAWQGQRVSKIAIDINRKFLQQSRKYCDVVLASASNPPVNSDSIDLALFNLVLHHLKGQQTLQSSIREAHRVLTMDGMLIAIEPNSLNFSGFLLNMINKFHLYSRLFGGSNYEYALSLREIRTLLSGIFRGKIVALTLLHPRFPLRVQRFILKNEKTLLRRFGRFAWMFLVTARKNRRLEVN